MKKTIKKLPKSQISIEVSIPHEPVESYREKALGAIGAEMEIAGFRKGKAPKNIIEKNINPMSLLEEMAQHAINEHFAKILVEEKIDAIGRPMIGITKLVPGNPLEFTATVAVFPQGDLPDYKALAKEINKDKKEVAVTDEEFEKAIIELKKVRNQQQKQMDEDTGEEVLKEHPEEEITEEKLDATLTDEEVKLFGPFESAEDFKQKYRENIRFEKEAQEREKRRVAMLEEIIKNTDLELPDVLVESELENLIGRLKTDLSGSGLKFEDYLVHIKKTEDEVRKDFLPDAEKRARMEFIMYKIGQMEKISPKEDEIEKETKRLMETYQGADETRARAYVTHLLSNEEIFRFLESIA